MADMLANCNCPHLTAIGNPLLDTLDDTVLRHEPASLQLLHWITVLATRLESLQANCSRTGESVALCRLRLTWHATGSHLRLAQIFVEIELHNSFV